LENVWLEFLDKSNEEEFGPRREEFIADFKQKQVGFKNLEFQQT
jgi:hypothetical protein